MKENTVEISRELAMSMWTKRYGKATKVTDFSGREIDKSAYDQRGSKYGWNLDHILPKSRGGKDTESNLICCHILTNDEKADKFPCFTANGKQFEIVKVENHYEIKAKAAVSSKNSAATNDESKEDQGINFYDHAAGIACYDSYQQQFWGSLTIKIDNPQSAAIVDFIKEIFDGNKVSAEYSYNALHIKVTEIRLPTKAAIQELRNKCMLLYTYLQYYFLRKKLVSSYRVFCEAHDQQKELEALGSSNNKYTGRDCFVINELIRCNSDAQEKIEPRKSIGMDSFGYRVYKHEWYWTKLKENLEKI